MIERLQELLAVREARLLALRAALIKALGELANVDQELAGLDGQLRQIHEQHRMWEEQWQDWLREDRVLRHGQDYNLHHVVLAAWTEDVQAQKSEVQTRRAAADEQVETARRAFLSAQQRLDMLRREHTTAVARARARAVGIGEARVLEDFLSRVPGR